MADLELLGRYGIFTVRRFLDGETCAALRGRYGAGTPARITRADGYTAVDESARRTLNVTPDEESCATIVDRLTGLSPTIAARFGMAIRGVQVPYFLHYRRGDYFRAHVDNSDDPRQPEVIRARKVAVVIFLNGESKTSRPDHYRGGELVFYRLAPSPTPEECRALLHGEEGLLVAFRTDVFHEVLPVIHGDRYTVVDWYL